ncbi:tetratricopeptide repeat protein, partial [Marinovum algicola]|uniref:tetratricopeptide repeat protein n=1 Tax=Marinovum algicola TaxID=42444 RepID=UPI0024BBCF48
THPVSQSRMADTRNRAEQLPPGGEQDSLEYQLMRARGQLKYEQSPGLSAKRFRALLDDHEGNHDAARYGLALALSRGGQHDEASEALAPLLKENPNSLPFNLAQIELDTNAGRLAQALERTRTMQQRFPNNFPLDFAEADLLLKQQQYADAERAIDRLANRRDDDPDVWYLAAEIRGLAGNILGVHLARAHYFKLTGDLQQAEQPGDFEPVVDVPGRGSYLTEFAVGKIGDVFRENTGKLLKAGSRIAFDTHYHSVSEEITSQTDVGIWFYPQGGVPKYRVYASALGVQQAMATMDIPPGKVTTHHAYIPLRAPARLENYQPHMHIRGKAMSMEAILPNGQVRMLSHVANFDFNWHVNYVYTDESAPVLPKGTVIHLTAWHDNTAANRANPDPTQWVGWGQRSFDEMYHAHVNMTYLTDEDYEQIIADRRARRTSND